MSDLEAATLPIAALTAWFALVDRGGIEAGQTVLVQGTGGVLLFGLQIAPAFGARVIVTSSSDAKLERARALGASEVINYVNTPDWQVVAREMTGDRGVDHVLEVVGGESLNRSVEAVRVGGHVVVIGFLSGRFPNLYLLSLIWRQARVEGITVGHRQAFERMNRFFEEHAIKPVIDSTYPFEDARSAFDHLTRGPFGKVVIDVAG